MLMHSIMDPTVGTFAGSIALTEDSLIPTEDSLIPTEDIPPASDNILARFTVGITGPAQTIPLLHRSAVVDAFGGAELNVLNRGGVLCRPRLRCGISIRPWQELSDLLQHWSGAVMCPACLCGGEAAGHNALRGSGPNQKLAFKMR